MKSLRLALAAGTVALALSGCTLVKNLPGALTGNSVPSAQVKTAIDAYDIGEVTATKYIAYCTPNPEPAGCSDAAIQALIPAVRSGNIGKTNMLAYLAANPGVLGPSNYYNAIVSAENTINSVVAQYNIAPAATAPAITTATASE